MSVEETPGVSSNPDARPLAGKVCLVTGGSRGIGRAIAEALGGAGAAVAVNYQSSQAKAEEVAAALREAGGRAAAYQADVADPAAVGAMVERIIDELGPVDVLVNNAGITRDRTFLKMTFEQWKQVIDVNLNSMYIVTSAVLGSMVERGWGRVINIASFVGQTGNFGQTNYAAAKAGIIGFTKALARETARKGVTVNAIAPGFIRTDMVAAIPDKVIEKINATIPIGRMGEADEVAAVAVLLADPAASYVTGQVYGANGGIYM